MKYLISGIGPGNGGVGRLMKALVPQYINSGYKIIYRRESKSVKALMAEKKYFHAYGEVLLRLYYSFTFYLRTYFIKNSEIIFLHPQTAGYKLLLRLIKRNKLEIYVMDNSFFCIRSYNTHPVKMIECIKCLGNVQPEIECFSFPIKIKKSKNIKYLKLLSQRSSDVSFLSQNNLQAVLIKQHFGVNTKVKVIGMETNEIISSSLNEKRKSEDESEYDVVFHGSSIIAKGVAYVVGLAYCTPEYTFFIPDDIENVVKNVERDLPNNITCQKMSWETGLKEKVISAKLVINPSMWSAPIEGALLKSAAFNDNVATVKTKYGFENEINTIKNHLRLDDNAIAGALQLRNFLG